MGQKQNTRMVINILLFLFPLVCSAFPVDTSLGEPKMLYVSGFGRIYTIYEGENSAAYLDTLTGETVISQLGDAPLVKFVSQDDATFYFLNADGILIKTDRELAKISSIDISDIDPISFSITYFGIFLLSGNRKSIYRLSSGKLSASHLGSLIPKDAEDMDGNMLLILSENQITSFDELEIITSKISIPDSCTPDRIKYHPPWIILVGDKLCLKRYNKPDWKTLTLPDGTRDVDISSGTVFFLLKDRIETSQIK